MSYREFGEMSQITFLVGSAQIITILHRGRAAELGSLSPGAKMAMKIFVERVFTILASNASFFVRNRKLAKLTQ